MIELRWLLAKGEQPKYPLPCNRVLQYRQRPDIDTRSLPTNVVIGYKWSEWQDVPTVRDIGG